jgi:hypothetical protein
MLLIMANRNSGIAGAGIAALFPFWVAGSIFFQLSVLLIPNFSKGMFIVCTIILTALNTFVTPLLFIKLIYILR